MDLNIGDTVFVATWNSYKKQRPCPVCDTKKAVTLILGNGTHIELECAYCKLGYEPPTGYIADSYPYKPGVKTVIIESITMERDGDISFVSSCRVYSVAKHYGKTREDALAKAVTTVKKLNTEKIAKNERLDVKAKVHRSYSWNAGYYLRQAESAKQEYERALAKAKVMQSKAR